jgi:hypothetical protein
MANKTQEPITTPKNVIFEYSSAPFKKSNKGNIGLMLPFHEDGLDGAFIYVHPKLTEDQKLRITIHEALHAAYPDLTEKQVITGSRLIAKVVKLAGFKKV